MAMEEKDDAVGNSIVVPQKKSNMELLSDPVILFLGICPKVIGGTRTDICTPKSIAALHTVVRS